MNKVAENFRESLNEDFTATALKVLIILWLIFVAILVIFVIDNKWLLAGVLAYEMLP